MAIKKGLGELLVRDNVININQLEKARQEQKQSGGKLTTTLLELGFIKDKELADFMGKQYNLPTINLDEFDIDTEALKLVTPEICTKNTVIPIQKSGRSLVVAFSDPSNIFVKDDLGLLTRHKIEIVIASEAAIKRKIQQHFGDAVSDKISDIMSNFEESEEAFTHQKSDAQVIDHQMGADEGPVVSFVNAMLAEAIKLKASDIHVEPYEKRFRIRYRIDGRLTERTQPPQGTANAIVSRLKILSKMDIAERRRPQDGRIKVRVKSGKDVDFRVNSVPTLFGEKVVMRLLDKSNLQTDLTMLGMEESELEKFSEALQKPQGLLLITGPTGSGKTTTIYSAIGELNKPDTNIQTAEDPVEFNLDGINQVQVNTEIGFGFPEALRAFLRQDPEVIMVGEIRDYDTAAIAYKAASTGHLVVSTLHTNDTTSTVTRLIDMGIPNYMVAESTTMIVAQRLIKRICEACKDEHSVNNDTLLKLGVREEELSNFQNLMKGAGCVQCDYTGLRGRIAVFEVLEVTTAVKEGIFEGLSPLQLKRKAIKEDGLISLRRNALLKLQRGITTVEEVLNGTMGDDK